MAFPSPDNFKEPQSLQEYRTRYRMAMKAITRVNADKKNPNRLLPSGERMSPAEWREWLGKAEMARTFSIQELEGLSAWFQEYKEKEKKDRHEAMLAAFQDIKSALARLEKKVDDALYEPDDHGE